MRHDNLFLLCKNDCIIKPAFVVKKCFMGSSTSKQECSAALLLCKDRLRYMKQAVDGRYALSAAQLSYEQSLRNVGIALRQFVESNCECEAGKSPSHSSYASLSPSPLVDHADLPVNGGSPSEPRHSNVSYMRSTVSTSLKLTVSSTESNFIQEEQQPISPVFPPPPPHLCSSWDFFDPNDAINNIASQNHKHSQNISLRRLEDLRHSNGRDLASRIEERREKYEGKKLDTSSSRKDHRNDSCPKLQHSGCDEIKMAYTHLANGSSSGIATDLMGKQVAKFGGLNSRSIGTDEDNEASPIAVSSRLCQSKIDKVDLPRGSCSEREDTSNFITRRAKDFLSSVEEIQHHFTRAAESCHEVSRMLETRKIRLSICSETIGKSSDALFLSAFLFCCKAGNVAYHESDQHVTKVITWNRSVSSQSSSSRNPLMSAPKDDDLAESGSDFIEEFCMISGSHSSTLDRLYAWERKLYDELKASDSLRKAYNKKCAQLRHQFARDLDARHIDKTRSTVKDLHSRLMVATEALHSISKRIEKLRDEELQPQLVELIQGLMRMWRIMLETHHAQHITISLAYHTKISSISPPSESCKQAQMNLTSEIDCFSSSFSNWANAHKCYVDALHSWLQKCIVQPQQRSRGRKWTFSPRRLLAPPIFVLLRDWSTGITSLPSEEACDSIKQLTADLHKMFKHQAQDKPARKKSSDADTEASPNQGCNEVENSKTQSKVPNLQVSLATMFDRLSKLSEAMIKMYENVKQEFENARDAYADSRFR